MSRTAVVLLACLVAAWAKTDHLNPVGTVWDKHSLTPPFLDDDASVPNWDFSGSTVIGEEHIRLTPDRQSRRGAIWNKIPVKMFQWEVVIAFKIHGQGKNGLFGDGFAFWYTGDRNVEGPVFGSKDKFNGLGVFVDTYNNNPGHKHAHPYISAVIGDGYVSYDHDAEGTHHELAGCQAYVRVNHPTRMKIVYRMHTLSVYTDVKNLGRWDRCFEAKGVHLPPGYFFGVTASTGHLADNHDIYSIMVSEGTELTEAEENAMHVTRLAQVAKGFANKPHAERHAPEREHVHGEETAEEGSNAFLYFLILVVIAGGVGYFVFLQKKSDVRTGKRMV